MQMKSVGNFCGLILLIGLMTGCMNGTFGRSGTTVQPIGDDLANETTLVESYGDIDLPVEMSLITDKSIAMSTDSFKGGIHSYSGRVQVGSLKDYLIASMRNNQWKLVGEASYKNVMLAFTKPNKTCMVVLSEGIGGTLGKTQADFYVTVDVAAMNRTNPFSSPVTQ